MCCEARFKGERFFRASYCSRIVSCQAVIDAGLGKANGKHFLDFVDERYAFLQVEKAPFRHVVIRAVDVEAEMAYAGQLDTGPQPWLDVGRHQSGYGCVWRHNGGVA